MGCGCSGKPWEPKEGDKPGTLAGPANPQFTWPPKGNGPKPSSKA